MTGCESCAKAEETGIPGFLDASCIDCTVRGLAGGLMYFNAAKAGKVTEPYRAALEKAFGAKWRNGHQLVKEYAARIASKSK